jgi:hypothetical protein
VAAIARIPDQQIAAPHSRPGSRGQRRHNGRLAFVGGGVGFGGKLSPAMEGARETPANGYRRVATVDPEDDQVLAATAGPLRNSRGRSTPRITRINSAGTRR